MRLIWYHGYSAPYIVAYPWHTQIIINAKSPKYQRLTAAFSLIGAVSVEDSYYRLYEMGEGEFAAIMGDGNEPDVDG